MAIRQGSTSVCCRRSSWNVRLGLLLCVVSALTTRSYADDSAEGRLYFTRYCTSCHGPVADGHGPVAKVLHVPPTDLRRLSERYGSPLPPDSIVRFIDGRESVPAHGERDMPVWGKRFHDINAEGPVRETEIRTRMTKMVAYLNSLQRETRLPRERKP
jgi:mono/diheme cytochrome c family protein